MRRFFGLAPLPPSATCSLPLPPSPPPNSACRSKPLSPHFCPRPRASVAACRGWLLASTAAARAAPRGGLLSCPLNHDLSNTETTQTTPLFHTYNHHPATSCPCSLCPPLFISPKHHLCVCSLSGRSTGRVGAGALITHPSAFSFLAAPAQRRFPDSLTPLSFLAAAITHTFSQCADMICCCCRADQVPHSSNFLAFWRPGSFFGNDRHHDNDNSSAAARVSV